MRKAGRPDSSEPADLTYRPAAADDRERPLVEVLERRGGAGPARADALGHVMGLLDRNRRQPRQRLAAGPVEARDVADHRDLGVAGNA